MNINFKKYGYENFRNHLISVCAFIHCINDRNGVVPFWSDVYKQRMLRVCFIGGYGKST